MSASPTSEVLTDKALRKAWLKRKFGSFEYHEEVLAIHAQWLAHIRAALVRAEHDSAAEQPGPWLRTKALPTLDKVARPGKLNAAQWEPGRQAGWARDIRYYGIDSGLDLEDTWSWMTEAERTRMDELWNRMARMAQNICYTADGNWDAHADEPYWILNEKYTGPIDWPVDWCNELLGPQGAALAATPALRVKAGEPVPQAGVWQSVDASAHQRRVAAADTLPDLGSAYGITVWQRVGE